MRRIFIGVVAGLALAGTTVSAQPGGNDRGRGNDQGGEAAPGNAKGDKLSAASGMKEQGPQKAADKGPPAGDARKEDKQAAGPAMHSPVRSQDQKPGKPEDAAKKPARLAENEAPGRQAKKAEDKGNRDAPGKNLASPPSERKDLKHATFRGPSGKQFIVPTDDRVRILTGRRDFDWGSLYRRSVFNGCPPGLAKKYNGCMPPGLDRQRSYGWLEPGWYLHDYDRAYRYRYLDGYMLRLGAGDSVLSYIPLLGGALGIGQVWPAAYAPVALPPYYGDYYGLGSVDSYRYYDGVIYHVDPDTAAIQSVAALLTGNDVIIGQPMPAGYDIYNVPYGYRDQYYDGPDALYRYSDGYIYQLDPTTRLVQAAIELLI